MSPLARKRPPEAGNYELRFKRLRMHVENIETGLHVRADDNALVAEEVLVMRSLRAALTEACGDDSKKRVVKKRAFKRYIVITSDNDRHPHDTAWWYVVDVLRKHGRQDAMDVVQRHLAQANGVPMDECPFTINLCIEAKGLVRALNAVKPDLRAEETE